MLRKIPFRQQSKDLRERGRQEISQLSPDSYLFTFCLTGIQRHCSFSVLPTFISVVPHQRKRQRSLPTVAPGAGEEEETALIYLSRERQSAQQKRETRPRAEEAAIGMSQAIFEEYSLGVEVDRSSSKLQQV
jgi:hypothetical protein